MIEAFRVSGYVRGPCTKCNKENRGLVMFDDYGLGWECLECGEVGHADRVEWVDGTDADPSMPDAGLDDP